MNLQDEVTKQALDLMEKYALLDMGWVFGFDRAIRRAGLCDFKKKRISVSHKWIEHAPKDEIKDVIIHEIAHALAGPVGHSKEWKKLAILLGGSGKTTTDVQTLSKSSYVGICPRGHSVNRERLPLRVYSCVQCSKKFNKDYILFWTKDGKIVTNMPKKYMQELQRIMSR